MKIERKTMNLGKVYFWYLFFVLFLQIIGMDGKSDTLELLWKMAVICCTMLYILYKNSWNVTKTLVFPLIIYAGGQILAYMNFPGATISTFINSMVVIGMTYMFISLTSGDSGFQLEDMLWFVKAFTALMLYAVAYQIITDPNAVSGALTQESVYSDMMSSFFDNKQTFGMFLFVAIIVSCLGLVLSKKKIYVAFALLFFGMLFICSSRTSLIACIVFVLMMLVLLFRSNRKLAGFVLLFVGLFVFFVRIVPSLNRFVTEVLIDTERTVDAREEIWGICFQAMRGVKVLFGYGEGNAGVVIREINPNVVSNTHNGLVLVFMAGGLIKIVLYVLVIINSLRCIKGIHKHNAALANVLFAAVVGLIAFSMGEALVFLDTSSPCVVASIVGVAFPIAVDRYYCGGNKGND